MFVKNLKIGYRDAKVKSRSESLKNVHESGKEWATSLEWESNPEGMPGTYLFATRYWAPTFKDRVKIALGFKVDFAFHVALQNAGAALCDQVQSKIVRGYAEPNQLKFKRLP